MKTEGLEKFGRACPGFVMTMGNHIPNGVPADNLRAYFDGFAEMRARGRA